MTQAATEDNIWISRLDADEVATAIGGADSGPLAGQRVAVKDNIDVFGFATTAGCPTYAYGPQETAPAIARLVERGAVVVGKTNLDQFATGLVGTRSPYGAVESPVKAGFISGGSSSGSAAAVALGQADIGIATDTAGSGRVPAALCGLIGLKGTRGWVPNRGSVPACPSFDCTTVLARTLDGAAVALRSMTGFDPLDPTSRPKPQGGFAPVKRLAVLTDDMLDGCEPSVMAAYRAMADRAATLGFECVTVDLSAYFEAGRLLYEGAFVAERHSSVGAFVSGGSDDLDPSVAAIVNRAAEITGSAYVTDKQRLGHLAARAAKVWYQADAVLLPTVPFHPTLAQVADDPLGVNLALGRFVTGANLVDWCAAAIPASGTDPVGVQLLGPAWSDEAIWQAAATLLDVPLRPAVVDERYSNHQASDHGVLLAVLGAHLEGQPLNHQLTSRGGTLVETTRSAPAYRMVVLDGPLPKPGLLRDPTVGASVEMEIWRLDHLGFGQFVTEVPSPLTIGTIDLEDGRTVQGFLCESDAVSSAEDISHLGGWRAWLAYRETTQAT